VPVSQPLASEQAPPAVHAEQVPLLQTMLLPQVVPLATLVVVARQLCVPEEQSVLPVRHGLLVGVHARPAVHDTHEPPLHTRFVPQFVPGAVFVRPLVQACTPVAHEMVPVLQPLLTLQDPPAVQLQRPEPLQKVVPPVPQAVPGFAFDRLAEQTCAPVEHE
jgi:hypothetical protein